MDNNEKLWGTKILDKYIVFSPQELNAIAFDYIIISSIQYQEEIREQLNAMGFADKIRKTSLIKSEDAKQNSISIIDSSSECRVICEKPIDIEGVTISYGTYIGAYTYIRKDVRLMCVSKMVDIVRLLLILCYGMGIIQFPLNQNQFDALTSFCYNCGKGNLKALVSGRDAETVANIMLSYNIGGGKTLAGLTRRREEERKLFLS